MTLYSHDGIRDSLTQLAAPTLFYEELRRALARATRNAEAVCLVRFVLKSHVATLDISDSPSDSFYEEEIVSFAQTLTRLCRQEDLCARMGQMEFVSILPGDELAPLRLISRITLHWRDDLARHRGSRFEDRLELKTSHVISRPAETPLALLDRLDSA